MDAKEVTLLLQQELAGLLGFDDGAGDVLAHLLTIASSEVGLYDIGCPCPCPCWHVSVPGRSYPTPFPTS
jgi:hypothetical protein